VQGGPGSAFWFEVALPVIEMTTLPAQPPDQVITGYKGPRRKVLVADDVPSNRAVMVDLLEPLGFEIVEAEDGRQALELAQAIRPELILMDRRMPVLSGLEATRQIRQMPELQGVVIVSMSASVSEEDQALSQKAGYDAFLPKPVNWPKLTALLQEHLALEWVYEEETRRVRQDEGEAVLVPPPQEALVILRDLAMKGNMIALKEQATYLEKMDRELGPFVGKLHQLTREFEEDQILALIERYMEDKR
jgi:CheY-like chemotaxis protein